MRSEFSEFAEFSEFRLPRLARPNNESVVDGKFSLTNKYSRRDFVTKTAYFSLAYWMAESFRLPTTTLMNEHVLWFSGPRLNNPGYTPIPEDLRSETVDFAVSLLNDAARVGSYSLFLNAANRIACTKK
jgi:hypothetical protein